MTPLPTLKEGASHRLDTLLKETVAKRTVPAICYGATNAERTIYSNQAGDVRFGDSSAGEVDADTTTEMYSQTKFITCIAALQLIDKKLVSLDSSEDIEKHLPELGKLEILKGYEEDGKPILVKATKKITLRMLMSHSAGMTYASMDPSLAKWFEHNPRPSIFDPKATIDVLCTPLIYEPGTSWKYSISIDWVGILIERLSNLTLEEYFQNHIFIPCGVTTLTFHPTPAIKAKKMALCTRDSEGKVQPTSNGFGMGRPTDSTGLLLGGAGLYGTQKDYLAILRAILQCDPSSPRHSPKPLLSPESYAELWKPSVPTGEGFDGPTHMVAQISRPAYFDPPATTDNLNYSVGCLINLEDFTGRRKARSGCWSGAAKTQFWIDPTTGIAAVCGTQLLSPAPDPWFAIYCEFEKELYAGLA